MRAAAGLCETGTECSKRLEITGIALWQRPQGKKTKCRAASDPELSLAEPVDSSVASAIVLSHPASPPRAVGIRPSRRQRQKAGQHCSWSTPRSWQEEHELSSQISLQSHAWELPIEMCPPPSDLHSPMVSSSHPPCPEGPVMQRGSDRSPPPLTHTHTLLTSDLKCFWGALAFPSTAARIAFLSCFTSRKLNLHQNQTRDKYGGVRKKNCSPCRDVSKSLEQNIICTQRALGS